MFLQRHTEKNNNAKCYWTINKFHNPANLDIFANLPSVSQAVSFSDTTPELFRVLTVWKQTLVAMPTGLPTAWQQFVSSWEGLTFSGIDLQQCMSKQCFINTRHELIPVDQKLHRSFNGCCKPYAKKSTLIQLWNVYSDICQWRYLYNNYNNLAENDKEIIFR